MHTMKESPKLRERVTLVVLVMPTDTKKVIT